MEITYNLIQPLIIKEDANGGKMECEFEVPETGEVVPSKVSIRRDRSMAGQIKSRVTRTVTNRARTSVSRMVRGFLGGGMLGSIGSQVVNTGSRELTQDLTRGFSDREKQAAVVEAFKKVAKHFQYDDVLGWQKGTIAAAASRSSKRETPTTERKKVERNASEFEKLVHKNPITNSFEQDVLGRVLIEIAQADGGISADEEAFLKEFIPNYGTFSQKPLLTPIECEEVSKNNKSTIYLLAWAVALVDLELSPLEEGKLFELGDWFEFDDKTMDNTVRVTKSFILEQNLTLTSSNEEAVTIGKLLGLSDDEALRTFIKFKKRMG
jgi:hypothetical protein